MGLTVYTIYVLVTYKGEKKSEVCAERPASSRVHAVIVTPKGLDRKNRGLQYCTTQIEIDPFGG